MQGSFSVFTVTNGSITTATFDAATASGNNVFCLNSPSGIGSCGSNFDAFSLDSFSTFVSNTNGFSAITFSSATPVPFETEPTLGILLAAAFFGSRHLHRKHKAKKLLFNNK